MRMIMVITWCYLVSLLWSLPIESTRHNFCEIYENVENGQLALKDALNGMVISAAHTYESTNENSFVAARVLDKLASLGNFTVNYFSTLRPASNETWTDILVRDVKKYDLACDRWERRMARIEREVLFTDAWYNSDMIMMKKQNKKGNKFNFWAFSQAFSPLLWGLSLIMIFATGMVYYLLDYLKSRSNNQKKDTNLSGSIFFSFFSFTGHCNYTARSKSTQLLTTSMCFLYLILISSYTANLANFFIASNEPNYEINQISDVFTNKLTLCIRKGIPLQTKLKERFSIGSFIYVNSMDELFEAVNSGICDVAAIHSDEWLTFGRDDKYNRDCSLNWVGRRIDSVDVGFGLKDSKEYCSALLKNALNRFITQMKVDGILNEVIDSYRESVATSTCEVTYSKDENTQIYQLSANQLRGAFAFHMILVFISILFAIFEFNYQPKTVKQQIKGDLLSSFEEVMRPSKGLFIDDEESNEDSLSRFSPTFGSLRKVQNFCAELNEVDINKLILQEQLMFIHKVQDTVEIAQRNQELFSKNFKFVSNYQDETIKELRQKIDKMESLMKKK